MVMIWYGWVKDCAAQSLLTQDLWGCQGFPTLVVIGKNKMKPFLSYCDLSSPTSRAL